MVRYLHSILLAGLLAGVLALGLSVGAAAAAPMEPFVPPTPPKEPSDPQTNVEMYGWGTSDVDLVYDRSVWYVREKKTTGIHSGKWQNFRQGQPWYQVYVDWTKTHELPWEYADYNAKITRTEFARLFAAVYRSSETMQKTVQPINTVPDGAIPDVAMGDANAADIYLLYRLGVLAGSDEAHHFEPNSQILRSEVAAIACRLLGEGRQSFSIT